MRLLAAGVPVPTQQLSRVDLQLMLAAPGKLRPVEHFVALD
jgi:hypothetical protein